MIQPFAKDPIVLSCGTSPEYHESSIRPEGQGKIKGLRVIRRILLHLFAAAALSGCGSPSPHEGSAQQQPTELASVPIEQTDAATPVETPAAQDPNSVQLAPLDQAGRRFALVFGNGAYPHGDALPSAPKDAVLIGKALQARGYHVLVGLDRTLSQMRQDLHSFESMSAQAETRVIYFAGHGFEFEHSNYLMPVDLPVSIREMDAQQIQTNAVRLDDVLMPLQDAEGVVIALIDACRVGPSRGSRQALALGKFSPPQGTILAYATAPGQTASDSLRAYGFDADHSPYAFFLASALSDKSIDRWDQALMAATSVVKTQTRGAQQPWINVQANSIPDLGPLETDSTLGSGSALANALFGNISPQRKALGSYWAMREQAAWSLARDRQMFDDELFAMGQAGNEDAALALAYRLSDFQGKPEESIRILEPLAESGNAAAQLALGTTLYALPARDSKGRKANHWWQQASAQGMGEARAKLALAEGRADPDVLAEFVTGIMEFHAGGQSTLPQSDSETEGQSRE